MIMTIADGYKNGDLVEIPGKIKREMLKNARQLKRDNKIDYAEIYVVDRCSCGCGSAHPDRDISMVKI